MVAKSHLAFACMLQEFPQEGEGECRHSSLLDGFTITCGSIGKLIVKLL